jgi:putative transposase
MSTDPRLHRRKSIRIRGYDYTAPGRYYVTVCVKNRECLFGNIVNGEMHLNDFGRIVQHTWDELPNHFPTVALDALVIMPNHIHGIIGITDWVYYVGAQLNCAPTEIHTGWPLGHIVRSLKSFSTRNINALRGTPAHPVWQRNYYERVIRNDQELERIRRYIADNPAKWELDEKNPDRGG